MNNSNQDQRHDTNNRKSVLGNVEQAHVPVSHMVTTQANLSISTDDTPIQLTKGTRPPTIRPTTQLDLRAAYGLDTPPAKNVKVDPLPASGSDRPPTILRLPENDEQQTDSLSAAFGFIASESFTPTRQPPSTNSTHSPPRSSNLEHPFPTKDHSSPSKSIKEEILEEETNDLREEIVDLRRRKLSLEELYKNEIERNEKIEHKIDDRRKVAAASVLGRKIDRVEIENLQEQVSAFIELKDMLHQDNIRLKRLIHETSERDACQGDCLVCWDNMSNVIVRDCNHLALCQVCADDLRKTNKKFECPVCRTEAKGTLVVQAPVKKMQRKTSRQKSNASSGSKSIDSFDQML